MSVAETYDRLTNHYSRSKLYAGEERFLRLIEKEISQWDVLDIGVGTGRTTPYFGNNARSYLGIDFSSAMLARARENHPRYDFQLLDATQLQRLNRKFDLILFPLNGIDSLTHEERFRILEEVAACLRPDGKFFFSTHSLEKFPYPVGIPRNFKKLYWHVRMRFENRRRNWKAEKERGWAVVQSGAHRFALPQHMTTFEYQKKELEEAGLEIEAIWNNRGQDRPLPTIWNCYVCKLKSGA